MENFEALGLPEAIVHSLKKLNFEKPTPIQAQTIPLALEGKDILGSAQTGTGKTAAYALPLLAYLMANPHKTALVMTPTRELAQQVMDNIRGFMGNDREQKIWVALLIGGAPMGQQFQQLRNRPRLIIGTPGRINDHLERGTLKLDKMGFLVLDETDRMLDMGFVVQLERIASHMNPDRQTLMFSATIAPTIERLANNYLKNPVRVSVGSTIKAAEKITQEVIKTTDADKFDLLVKTLNQKQGTFIVFVKTKYGTEKLAKKLNDQGHSADAVHGDLRQSRRSNVISAFRRGKNRVLVATDVAARGLDIPHIEYVVNFDLPQAPEDFIHRIGRTGRAGAEGTAISFVSAGEYGKWRAICRLMHPEDRAKGLEGFEQESRGGGRDSRARSNRNRHRPGENREAWGRNRPGERTGERTGERAGERGAQDRRPKEASRGNSQGFQERRDSTPTAERKFQSPFQNSTRRSENRFDRDPRRKDPSQDRRPKEASRGNPQGSQERRDSTPTAERKFQNPFQDSTRRSENRFDQDRRRKDPSQGRFQDRKPSNRLGSSKSRGW
jgi:ATP-dependent RNA helicase DeaD